jgi:hypothetical protein
MRRCPHSYSVQVDCAGVLMGASSYARLESWDRWLCVRHEDVNPVAKEFELSLSLEVARNF